MLLLSKRNEQIFRQAPVEKRPGAVHVFHHQAGRLVQLYPWALSRGDQTIIGIKVNKYLKRTAGFYALGHKTVGQEHALAAFVAQVQALGLRVGDRQSVKQTGCHHGVLRILRGVSVFTDGKVF